MTIPSGLIRLTGECIRGERVCCTGQQLVDILEVLDQFMPKVVWYETDISTIDHRILRDDTSLGGPTRVGATIKMVQHAQKSQQFLTGVFLAVKDGSSLEPKGSWYTEDEPFRELQGADIEIRAFDTTYFEVYAVDEKMVEVLRDQYGGVIVRPK